ncbi:MAG TPA: FAD-dependent oxidoreductase [Steroidobacteraceae bacterium]|nr:FAD-dependent oxidoreductase [Steroidobacteraceae bacterium]
MPDTRVDLSAATPAAMPATDTSQPDYYHRVVDCQWACPAHTDVPEYIRMIAQGRFADAYLLNRESNVFPGILGRVCDRPCEPACRRGRVEDKPVAICRLKRVAADLKGEGITARLPKAPAVKNGKRIACIGAGPASLTVANDLAPLGYDVTIFEQHSAPGGLMRSNIPSFRLPQPVLDEEIGMILDLGVSLKLGSPIDSLGGLLAQGGFDAIFVGSGAPKGKDLPLPGRQADNVYIGIDWLESVAFGHVGSIGERVLIIGVGNTAMDCCRTSMRLGATSVKVMARKPRSFFKASAWELEDAEEERVEIIVNHAPTAFVLDAGRVVGMRFNRMEYELDGARIVAERVVDEVTIPCDAVILAIGQENAFPWIERDVGVQFDRQGQPLVDAVTFQSTRPEVFFGGDAAQGPKNIIWAVEHGHQAALSIHGYLHGLSPAIRPPATIGLSSRKMGLHEWAYKNDYAPLERRLMPHVSLKERFKKISIEVELGFTPEQAAQEAQRCLNCDVQTVFEARLCIECDACIDICPVDCLTIAANGSETEVHTRLRAPALDPAQALYASAPLPQTGRIMLKDENLCLHCGLCAERCPTAAWDMQKSTLHWPLADNGNSRCQPLARKTA